MTQLGLWWNRALIHQKGLEGAVAWMYPSKNSSVDNVTVLMVSGPKDKTSGIWFRPLWKRLLELSTADLPPLLYEDTEHTCTHPYMDTHIHTCVHAHTFINVLAHVHTHMHAYMHIHTCTRIHAYTQTLTRMWGSIDSEPAAVSSWTYRSPTVQRSKFLAFTHFPASGIFLQLQNWLWKRLCWDTF